jgi:hypothetical protein
MYYHWTDQHFEGCNKNTWPYRTGAPIANKYNLQNFLLKKGYRQDNTVLWIRFRIQHFMSLRIWIQGFDEQEL